MIFHSSAFRWLVLLTVLSVATSSCRSPESKSASEGKPTAPIDISIEPDASPAPGATVPLTVRVTPRVPAPQIEITMQMSDGVRVISGDTAWSGSLAAGESHELRFRVELPSKGVVDITTWAKAGRGLVRGKTYSIDLGGKAQKPAPEYKSGSHGEKILEVPLQ